MALRHAVDARRVAAHPSEVVGTQTGVSRCHPSLMIRRFRFFRYLLYFCGTRDLYNHH